MRRFLFSLGILIVSSFCQMTPTNDESNNSVLLHQLYPTPSERESRTRPERSLISRKTRLSSDKDSTSRGISELGSRRYRSRSTRSADLVSDTPLDDFLSNSESMITEEAKVFRPLFVYRQQIAKQLRLSNKRDQKQNKGIQYPIPSSTPRNFYQPYYYNYYYRPQPYYYYP